MEKYFQKLGVTDTLFCMCLTHFLLFPSEDSLMFWGSSLCVSQRLILKRRSTWLRPRRRRPGSRSSCRPSWSLQSGSPIPAACWTRPPRPVAKRAPHRRVSAVTWRRVRMWLVVSENTESRMLFKRKWFISVNYLKNSFKLKCLSMWAQDHL